MVTMCICVCISLYLSLRRGGDEMMSEVLMPRRAPAERAGVGVARAPSEECTAGRRSASSRDRPRGRPGVSEAKDTLLAPFLFGHCCGSMPLPAARDPWPYISSFSLPIDRSIAGVSRWWPSSPWAWGRHGHTAQTTQSCLSHDSGRSDGHL